VNRIARHGGRIAAVVLVLGLLRLFVLVLHAPLAGYANQYDMARSSDCLGLWPDLPAEQQALATPAAPRTDYRYGGATGAACYPSTAVLAARLALELDAAVEELRGEVVRDFDLRQLGALYALVGALIALALHRGLAAHPGWQLGHAVLVALVLADPFNSLLFNTLYTEAPALLALYGGLGLLLRLALGAPAGPLLLAGLAVALLALGFSRVQHLLQPLALALPAAWLLWPRGRDARAAVLGLLLLSLAVPLLQFGQQREHPGIAAANRSNAVLGALLPAASVPERMTARLGLPPRCATLEHASWYLRRGRDVQAECPELAQLPLWRLGAAVVLDPPAALVLAGRGLAQATAWRLPYLGELAGAAFARVPHPSLADALAMRGFRTHAVLWLAPALLLLLRQTALRRREAPARDVLLLACLAVASTGWASALLGDGYSELTRHLHLAQNAILVAWALLLAWLWPARDRSPDLASRLAAPAAVLVAAVLAAAWLRLPLAEGVLELAATADGGVEASGWALDPSGIAGLSAWVDGRRHPMPLLPAPDVARVFPLPGATAPATARFRLVLPAAAAQAQWIALEVSGGYGQGSDADGLAPAAALAAPNRR